MSADLETYHAKWQWLTPGWTVVRKFDDTLEDLGICRVSLPVMKAWISIMPEGKEGEDDRPRDIEADYLHELLHVRFDPFRPRAGTLKHDLWEQAVEMTARDLLTLDRRK